MPSNGMLGTSVSHMSLRGQVRKLTSVRSNNMYRPYLSALLEIFQQLLQPQPGENSTLERCHIIMGLPLFRRNVPQLTQLFRRLCLTPKITTYGLFWCFVCRFPKNVMCVEQCRDTDDLKIWIAVATADNAEDFDRHVGQFNLMRFSLPWGMCVASWLSQSQFLIIIEKLYEIPVLKFERLHMLFQQIFPSVGTRTWH
jgi:hypothetical protein